MTSIIFRNVLKIFSDYNSIIDHFIKWESGCIEMPIMEEINRPPFRTKFFLYGERDNLSRIRSNIKICNTSWAWRSFSLVIIGARTAFLGVFGVILIEKIFKVHCSILVDICIALDLFCAIILGEACQVYRFVKGYDKIRHGMGALQFSILGYGIFRYFLGKTNKGKYQDLFAIIFAFLLGLPVNLL